MEKRTLSPTWREIFNILWWTALLYGAFMILYPYLVGCGCPYYEEHTCGVKQYLAPIGSFLCLPLWLLGIYLYRDRENRLVFHALLSMLSAACSLVLLCLNLFTSYLLTESVVSFVLTLVLSLPLFPYLGFLVLLEVGNGFYLFILVYTLVAAGLAIRQYRKLRYE